MAIQKYKDTIKLRNLGINGVIREAIVDSTSTLYPEGALTSAVNVHFDRMGGITQRNGATVIGLNLAGTCYGVYNAMFSNSGSNRLISVFSDGTYNKAYIWQGGTWVASLGGDTKDLKTRFATFGDNVIRVNGTDNMKCWDGGSLWITTGDPINVDDIAGTATAYIEVFKNKVYTAGNSTKPDRLFYSSVVSSAGNITWDPSNDWIDINPNDGENISALKRYATELLVFKPNYIYRFRTEAIEPDPLVKVGTRSQESIVEGKNGLYFCHDTGFYKYTGGYPEEISRPISDFIDAMNVSNAESVVAWKDNDHIYFSIGDVTVSGTDYTNVVIRYTESSQVWTIYSYATQPTYATDYDDGTTLFRVWGDDAGRIFKDNLGTADRITAISHNFETKWYDFENVAEKKILKEIVCICEKAQGSKVFYKIDGSDTWRSIGQINKFRTKFSQLKIPFHRIKFKVSGISSQEAAVFQGFEIVSMVNEGVID